MQFGGVGSVHIDFDLAPFVKNSFRKHIKNYLTDVDAPKMYRHQLTLTFDGEYGSESLIVYSSSDLNVNSLENLTTLLKPDSNTLFYGNTITSITPYTFQIIYDNNVWKTGPMDEELGKPNSTITAVSDIVTPA